MQQPATPLDFLAAVRSRLFFQERLAQDAMHSIFLFLEGQDVGRLAVLCQNVCQSLRSPGLWAQLFQRDFHFIPEVAFLQSHVLACTSSDAAVRARVLDMNRGSYRRAFQLVTRPRVQRCVRLSADLTQCQGPNERQGSSGCVLEIMLSKMPKQSEVSVEGKSQDEPPGSGDATSNSSVAEPHLAVFGGWTVGYPSIANDMYVAVRDVGPRATDFPAAWKWHPVTLSGQPRIPTYGHTLTSIGTGRCVLLGGVTAGGYRGETGSASVVEVWRETHSPPAVCGSPGSEKNGDNQAVYFGRLHHCDETKLTPRAYHSATWVARLGLGIIFGGFDQTGAIAALEAFRVRKICGHMGGGGAEAGDGGAARESGMSSRQRSHFVAPKSSAAGATSTSGQHWELKRIDLPLGTEPSPRFGHSATLLRERHLVIAGGSNGSSNYKGLSDGEELDDVHILDTGSMEWYQVTAHGQPYSRALSRCHSATPFGDSIVFFGGGPPGATTRTFSVAYFSFDSVAGRYTSVTWNPLAQAVEETQPGVLDEQAESGRRAGSDSDDESGDEADQGSTPANDMAVGLLPRQNHLSFLVDGAMYIQGGCLARTFGNEELSDFFVVNFEGTAAVDAASNMKDVREFEEEALETDLHGTFEGDEAVQNEYFLLRQLIAMGFFGRHVDGGDDDGDGDDEQ
eukprot:INCI14229.1.p1 GENE.INCI14229.1~~INCI14229.1.p1  ORF type:complete len:680 (-),score=124.33 INCI14229.1:1324-3363(-)